MKRLFFVACLVSIFVLSAFAGIASPVAHAAGAPIDAQAIVGMTVSELKAQYGGPSRTEPSEYGFTWYVYSRDYRNYFMAGVRGDAVVAIYASADNLRYGGDFASGGSRSSVRARLGSPVSYVRSGNTVAVLPDANQRDTFSAGDKYVTVFYDLVDGGKVTSVMIVPQDDQTRVMTAKRAISASLLAAYQRISVDLVNVARARRGLKALQTDALDTDLAVARSADMVSRNYFSHYTPDKRSPADLAKEMGLKFTTLGENIAYGNSNAMLAHESFMNSPDHRSNVLKSSYTKVGAGACYGGSLYVVVTNIFSNNTAEPPVTGIKTSHGQLSPSFSYDVDSYTVEVPATASQVKITPVKYSKNCKYILINGKKATYAYLKPPIGGSATAKIVAVSSNGKSQYTYTVTVTRAALVTDIDLSEGTLEFDPARLSYTVTVPADTESVTVTPAAAPAGVRSVTVSGATLRPAAGGSATAKIVALASDKKTKLTYTVTVKRDPIVTGIQVSGGSLSPAFSASKGSYSVKPSSSSKEVKLTAVGGANCAKLSINGEQTDSVTLNPAVGQSIPVKVTGKTARGTAVSYTVDVGNPALLTNIYSGTKGISVSPAFNAATQNYSVAMPAGAKSVSIRVTKAKSGVQYILINGKKCTSYTAKPVIGGTVAVSVVAVGKDGTKQSYTVMVTRAAPLVNLSASAGAMSPAFSAGVTSYDVYLPCSAASATITPAANTKCAVTNNVDNAHAWATLSPAPGGSKSVVFTAISSDRSNSVRYTVTVHRAGLLGGIDAGGQALSPAFDDSVTAYTVGVAANVASVAIAPRVKDGCGYAIEGLPANTPAELAPAPGGSAEAVIVVTGPGGAQMTYRVTARRAAMLSGIGLSAGALSPGFSTGKHDYTVRLAAGSGPVTVTPGVSAGCGYAINGGSAGEPLTLSVPAGGSATAEIIVSAGGARDIYTVTFRRDAALSGLEANAGGERLSLGPDGFRMNTLEYTVQAGNAASVTLSAPPAGSPVTLAFRQGGGNFENADSLEVQRPEGSDRVVVSIRCTPQNGLPPVTYEVTVIWTGGE
jgi:uncharacterized protein YkwD